MDEQTIEKVKVKAMSSLLQVVINKGCNQVICN